MERFSIRGYTANMRSSGHVLKCWPFDQTCKTDFIEAFLPPITLHNFKWWVEELENNNEAVTVTTAANGLAQSSTRSKSKSRVTKKRSIVEIFAVAPQVERLYDDDEDQDYVSSEDDDDDVKLSSLIRIPVDDKRNKNMRLEDRRLAIINKLKKLKGVVKKNKHKETDVSPINDISLMDKVKPFKLKKKHPIGSTGNSNGSSCPMDLAKDVLDVFPAQKRTPRPKCYVEGNKSISGTSKLTLEKQNSVLSLRGILKNNSKVASQKKSTACGLRDSSETSWYGDNQSDRRVRFSEADHPTEKGKLCVGLDVFGSDRSFSITKRNATERQSITEKHSSDACLCVRRPNFLRPPNSQEHLLNGPPALSQGEYCGESRAWLEHGCEDACPTFAPRFPSTEKEALMRGDKSMSISSGSNVKLVANARDMDPRTSLAAICCSRDYVNPFFQSSSSFFPKDSGVGYGRLLFPSETSSQNYNGHTSQLKPFPRFSPKELMHSVCSFPVIDQRGSQFESSKKGDFVGLPLNSQGELIQNSIDNGGLNQLMRPSAVSGSRMFELYSELPNNPEDRFNFNSCHETAPSKKQFQFFPMQDRVKENPSFTVSSRIGITEPQGRYSNRGDVPFLERGSSQSMYPLNPGYDLVNIPSNKTKQDDLIWNPSTGDRSMHQDRNHDLRLPNVTRPTMRLMGQSFSVTNSHRNLHEEELVWMDKQIIAEHRRVDASINNSARKQFQSDFVMQPASGKGKQIACSAEVQFNLASQSFFQIKPRDSTFSQPFFSAAYENAYGTYSGDPISRSYPYFPTDASPGLLNNQPVYQEPFVSEYEHLPINRQAERAPNPRVTFQNVSLNHTEPKDKYANYYSSNSAFKFPFLRPDIGEAVQPPFPQSSFKNVPPWLLNATQVKEIGSFRSYPDAGSCHPCTMSSENLLKIPSVCCKPDASCMYNPSSIQSPPRNAPGFAPISQSPLAPACHRLLPALKMANRHTYRMKFKERMKARLCVKDPGHGKRTKRRPSAKSDYSADLSKLHNMEGSEDQSRSSTALKDIGDAGADVLGRRETFGLDLAKDALKGVSCGQNSTQTDPSKARTKNYPVNRDGIAIPGPVKLTGGAKHILKPSESMSDESNSRLTHSKSPFAAGIKPGTIAESQMKSAKIYRF